MFTVTLLTNPETPVLDRVTVESLRNAWGGGDARWLDPGLAAEFPVPQLPENRWAVWQDLQSLRRSWYPLAWGRHPQGVPHAASGCAARQEG